MKKRTHMMILCLTCLLFAVAGCKEEKKVTETIRSIKTLTVSEKPTVQVLNFSGLVKAADSSVLSFEVSGQVSVVLVNIGDRVKKGQMLAELDPELYQLSVDEAQASLKKAKDNVTRTKAQFERQKRIFEQGAGAKSNLEVAEYEYKSALSAVNYQQAKLESAQHNLRKTRLFAPYEGTIASSPVEPHEKVQAGTKIFDINASGELEVQLDVSETDIDRLVIGGEAKVSFPTLPGETIQGLISEVGTAALEANAFPVRVALINPDKAIKPGMTAKTQLILNNDSEANRYLIPFQAILPADGQNQGYVFIFDNQTSKVRKSLVHMYKVVENQALIDEGLSSGDVIAIAGVSFLADGMQVKLMGK